MFVLLIAALLLQAPAVPSRTPKGENAKSAHKTENGQKATPNVTPIVAPSASPSINPSTADKKDAHHDDAQTQPYRVHIVKQPFDVLMLLYVIITGIAACLALRTLRALESQTKATKDSIELQKIHLKQWVDVTNFQGGNVLVSGDLQRRWLETYFDILNPTKNPITLKRIAVTVKEESSSQNFQHFLTPKSKYSSSFIIQLTPEEIQTFVHGGGTLVFAVTGDITFVNVFNEDEVQPFRFLASYSYGVAVKTDYKWV